jgi:hypothetical protein
MGIAILRRGGTRLESQLQWPAEKWLLDHGYVTTREFKTPWGISDVIGVKPNLDRSYQRLGLGHTLSLGDVSSVMVLLRIPTVASKRSASKAEVVSEMGDLIGVAEVEVILQRLIRKGIVAENGAGRLVRHTPWLPYHDGFVSVELKLQRVDEALKQAKRHRTITPSSYVGLPREIAEKVMTSERKADFVAAGVGLLSISGETCEEVISPAAEINAIERVYEIAAAERCWSRVLKTIEH